MLIIASLTFYISLGILLYLFFSKERKLLNHDELEVKTEAFISDAKRSFSYINKRTVSLLFHYLVDSIEEAFLSATQKLKNAVPKHKKKAPKQMADIKARTIKKPVSADLPVRPQQLPKH